MFWSLIQSVQEGAGERPLPVAVVRLLDARGFPGPVPLLPVVTVYSLHQASPRIGGMALDAPSCSSLIDDQRSTSSSPNEVECNSVSWSNRIYRFGRHTCHLIAVYVTLKHDHCNWLGHRSLRGWLMRLHGTHDAPREAVS